MNATLQSKDTSNNYTFKIEYEGIPYEAVIYCNAKGKFIDEEITNLDTNEELDYEGSEGEIREQIVSYLDENWNTLVQ